LQAYRSRLAVRYHVDRLLGDSPAIRQVRAQVRLAAASAVQVLVCGPPGSGRERVGRAIHYGDGRGAAGPLVPLSCRLLDAELLQATLRTMARARAAGERPATLLLNEVDALSEGGQTELQRAIASGNFAARVISTSRGPLTELAARGLFRADLAFLLSTLTISLPPLAVRVADLPLLVQWYLEQANLRSAKQIGGCSPETLDRLADYGWPGDLAELESVVGEAHQHAAGPLILPHDLPARLTLASQASARPAKTDEKIVLEEYLATIEHELIVRALKRAKGNKTKAARLLGMTRPRFYRRLVQLGLADG
jgi:DNA-binding NtrC family response regulator